MILSRVCTKLDQRRNFNFGDSENDFPEIMYFSVEAEKKADSQIPGDLPVYVFRQKLVCLANLWFYSFCFCPSPFSHSSANREDKGLFY